MHVLHAYPYQEGLTGLMISVRGLGHELTDILLTGCLDPDIQENVKLAVSIPISIICAACLHYLTEEGMVSSFFLCREWKCGCSEGTPQMWS